MVLRFDDPTGKILLPTALFYRMKITFLVLGQLIGHGMKS